MAWMLQSADPCMPGMTFSVPILATLSTPQETLRDIVPSDYAASIASGARQPGAPFPYRARRPSVQAGLFRSETMAEAEGTFSRGRLEAFSDGVIAVIITIMVLDLK